MPFDPTLPQAGTEIDAVQMRAQLTGLKSLIDAIAPLAAAEVDGVTTGDPGDPATAEVYVTGDTLHFTFTIPRGETGSPGMDGEHGGEGPQGPEGPPGPPFASAAVDGVDTLDPGNPATVDVIFDGTDVRFTFGIPRGADGGEGAEGPPGPPFASAVVDGVDTLDPGDPASVDVDFDGTNVRFAFGIPRGADGGEGPPGGDGAEGAEGPPGSDGAEGPQGPPFATAVIDGVDTLDPGNPATVDVSFDGTDVRFLFGIPRGADGADGADGPPGEVSAGDLAAAIAGTSANSNGVGELSLAVSDPPTHGEVQQIAEKLDELINALRR